MGGNARATHSALSSLGLIILPLLACHDSKRENPFGPVSTPAPQLQVALDDTAGTATLTWTPYGGSAASRPPPGTGLGVPALQGIWYIDGISISKESKGGCS